MFNFYTLTETCTKGQIQFLTEKTVYYLITSFYWLIDYIYWVEWLSQFFAKFNSDNAKTIKFFNYTAW